MPADIGQQPAAPHSARYHDPVELPRAGRRHGPRAPGRLLYDGHRRLLHGRNALLPRNVRHQRDCALALDIPRPIVVHAHLVVLDDELREPLPTLVGRHDRQVRSPALKVAPILVHWVPGPELSHDLEAARLMVYRLARPPLPLAPLHGCPLDQLHIRPAVSVPRAPNPLGYVSRSRIHIRYPALIEDRHFMPAPPQLDGRRQPEYSCANDSRLHTRSPTKYDSFSSVHHAAPMYPSPRILGGSKGCRAFPSQRRRRRVRLRAAVDDPRSMRYPTYESLYPRRNPCR